MSIGRYCWAGWQFVATARQPRARNVSRRLYLVHCVWRCGVSGAFPHLTSVVEYSTADGEIGPDGKGGSGVIPFAGCKTGASHVRAYPKGGEAGGVVQLSVAVVSSNVVSSSSRVMAPLTEAARVPASRRCTVCCPVPIVLGLGLSERMRERRPSSARRSTRVAVRSLRCTLGGAGIVARSPLVSRGRALEARLPTRPTTPKVLAHASNPVNAIANGSRSCDTSGKARRFAHGWQRNA